MRWSVQEVGHSLVRQRLRSRPLTLVVATSMILLVMSASTAMADAAAAPAPTISSDKGDYAPGETVALSGSNWQPGEVVHITVNDDQGKTWTRDVDVTADAGGSITDQFNLPDNFVAVYAVTATGPNSGTVTTTFTDGNAKVAANLAPGTTWTLTETLYQSGSNCTGTIKSGPTGLTLNGTQQDTAGVGSSESLKLAASATSSSGGSFSNWTGPTGSFMVLSPGVICVQGFQSGSRDFVANYLTAPANSAPAVTKNNASRTVGEGQTATNSGTWSDSNTGDTVTLSASAGTIVKSGTNASGTWTWAFPTSDGPDQSQTVTITASDGTATTTTTFALSVANLKPSVTLSGAATADEGDTKSYSYTVSDPGADTYSKSISCGANGELVTGSDDGSSFECSFPDGPATTTVSFSATDSDGASDTDNQSVTVTVANVAPTVTLSGADSANEGSTHSYDYSATDPGDDSPLEWTLECGDEGDFVAGSDDGSSFECSFPDGPANSSVSASAFDGSDSGSDSISVSVANLKPSVTLSGAATADEGDTKSYSYTVSDPGADTYSKSISCGANGELVTGSDDGSSFECSFPDGPATTTVSFSATDSDGASDTDNQSVTVTVANVAPTVTLSGADSANEGSTHSYDYSATDPGDDSPLEWTLECGDEGDFVAGSDDGSSFECSFPDGPANSSVSASAFDGSDSGSDSISVSVANLKPRIENFLMSGSGGVACAINVVTVTFTVSDPAAESHDPITGTINWGDGSTTATSGRTVTEAHTYSAGTHTLTATVYDGDGGSDSVGAAGNVSLLYTTSGFMQPINMDGTSNFKIGSTIPVKLKIFNCSGNQVTTLSPTVHLKKTGSAAGSVNEVVSSSAADTGNMMRHTGDSYMFNLSTKRSQFNAGQDLTEGRYELRVKHPTISDVVVEFDLRK